MSEKRARKENNNPSPTILSHSHLHIRFVHPVPIQSVHIQHRVQGAAGEGAAEGTCRVGGGPVAIGQPWRVDQGDAGGAPPPQVGHAGRQHGALQLAGEGVEGGDAFV